MRAAVEPERLVFTTTPLDEEGNPLFEVLNTVTFAEHAGKTTFTLVARGVAGGPIAGFFNTVLKMVDGPISC